MDRFNFRLKLGTVPTSPSSKQIILNPDHFPQCTYQRNPKGEGHLLAPHDSLDEHILNVPETRADVYVLHIKGDHAVFPRMHTPSSAVSWQIQIVKPVRRLPDFVEVRPEFDLGRIRTYSSNVPAEEHSATLYIGAFELGILVKILLRRCAAGLEYTGCYICLQELGVYTIDKGGC